MEKPTKPTNKSWAIITAVTTFNKTEAGSCSQILLFNLRLFSLPLKSNLLKILFCQWFITAHQRALPHAPFANTRSQTRLLSLCTHVQKSHEFFRVSLNMPKWFLSNGLLLKNLIKYDAVFILIRIHLKTNSQIIYDRFVTIYPLLVFVCFFCWVISWQIIFVSWNSHQLHLSDISNRTNRFDYKDRQKTNNSFDHLAPCKTIVQNLISLGSIINMSKHFLSGIMIIL